MLDNYCDIFVDDLPDELPPMRKISHQKYFIPGSNLPNKVAYRMTHTENEEIRKRVQELIDKGLIRESLSPCVVPAVLSPKKDRGWRMCTNSRASNLAWTLCKVSNTSALATCLPLLLPAPLATLTSILEFSVKKKNLQKQL